MSIVSLLLALSPAACTLDRSTAEPIRIESINPASRPEADRWFALDKFWHVSASFVTVGATYHLCANRLNMNPPWPAACALSATPSLGVAKELLDLRGPTRHFSWKDLAADALGVGLGYLVFIHRW